MTDKKTQTEIRKELLQARHRAEMRLDNPKISDRKIAEALGRPQRTFADQMKRYYTELHKIENK